MNGHVDMERMRYWDLKHGFGTILEIEGQRALVRFDASPWCPVWVPYGMED